MASDYKEDTFKRGACGDREVVGRGKKAKLLLCTCQTFMNPTKNPKDLQAKCDGCRHERYKHKVGMYFSFDKLHSSHLPFIFLPALLFDSCFSFSTSLDFCFVQLNL